MRTHRLWPIALLLVFELPIVSQSNAGSINAAVPTGLQGSQVQVSDSSTALVLEGTLTHADNQQYRKVPLTVPSGIRRITVDLSHTAKEKGVILNMGIWDPERFRGWGGGKRGPITISETDVTPSFLPGAIHSGTWTLLLGIPYLPEGVTSHYRATVRFDNLS